MKRSRLERRRYREKMNQPNKEGMVYIPNALIESRTALKSVGVYEVMLRLANDELIPLSLGAIADAAKVTKRTASVHLKRLIDEGFVVQVSKGLYRLSYTRTSCIRDGMDAPAF